MSRDREADVTLLEEAAARGDVREIEALYEKIGAFEFETSALVFAIAAGNTEAARTLLSHGTSVDCTTRDLDGDDGFASRRRSYLAQHLSEQTPVYLSRAGSDSSLHGYTRGNQPSRVSAASSEGYAYLMCITEDSGQTIERLARDGEFDEADQYGLMLAAAIKSNFELAELLVSLGAADGAADVRIDAQLPGSIFARTVRRLEDLIYPGCSAECARFVASRVDTFGDCWTPKFLDRDPEVISAIVPKLDPASVPKPGDLLRYLAVNGLDEQARLVAQWSSCQKRQIISDAIASASEAGRVQLASWLVAHRRELPPDRQGFSTGLEL